jgi:uncharacterized protein (DUF983 family)
VNTTSETKTPLKILRCPDCGTTGEFPASFTQKNVSDCCDVCQFHWRHSQDIDFHPRCAVCIAHLWQARLRALRILLFHPRLLREENS